MASLLWLAASRAIAPLILPTHRRLLHSILNGLTGLHPLNFSQVYLVSAESTPPMDLTTEPSTPEPSPSTRAKHPHKHNHYGFRDFFQFDADTGTIVDWNGSRNVLMTEDFIIGLVQGLDEEVGDASAAITYTIGCDWGQKDAVFFETWFEKEFNRNARQTNLLFLLETWWWPFTSQGWGRWEVDVGDRKQGFMFINICDSAVARTLGDVGKPVCYLYAGLFAGFFTELVRKPLSCIEIQCYSMGETYCKFLLGGQERIDAAAFWLNEGASAKDIEKRLRAGELLR